MEIIVPTHGMSDHYSVCFVHKYRGIKSGKFSHDEISYRNFKNLNHNEFVADLDNAPWSLLNMFDDVNEKLDTWEWTRPHCQEKSETYAFITVDEQ